MTVVGLNDEIWSSEVDSKNLGCVDDSSLMRLSPGFFQANLKSDFFNIKKDIGTLKMLFCTENNLDPNDMVLSKNNQLFRDELQERNDSFSSVRR